MATYDLTTSIPKADDLRDGDILNCPYSGSYKMIKLPKGIYKLECWGAQGGGTNVSGGTAYSGGPGGYSVGVINLIDKTKMYLYAGGKGSTANGRSGVISGGFNGGGSAQGNTGSSVGAGGGGTDIRIGIDSLYSRVIVAGGGGGASTIRSRNGANGGGTTGGDGYYSSSYYGNGGTQTAAGTSSYATGTFGIASTSTTNYVAGGGGGWYPGGQGYQSPGGGGSGYVYTSSTYSNYPSGCLLDSRYYLTNASTIAGNTSFKDPDTGSSTTGRSGNGYVRITCIEIYSGVYEKTESGWVKLYNTGIDKLIANSDCIIKKFIFKMSEKWSSVSTLPYNFYVGSDILLNNEIHILGSGYNSYRTSHYKYNTSTNTWSSVSTLPYEFTQSSSAIVLNNEIHILGSGYSSYYTSHYKISGEWILED